MAGARTALALVLLAAAGCGKHGKYTSELLDESQRNAAHLRAATQYDLASQRFHSGELELALESITSSIALNPEVAGSHLLHGRIELELGMADAALAAFEDGLVADAPEPDPDFHYYSGVALERLGRLDDALASYRSAVEAEPTAAAYALAVAEVLIDLDRLDEAQARLESAGEQFDAHPGFRQALGHIALLRGDAGKAVHYFTEAVVVSPDDPVLLEDLALALVAAERFADADAALRRLGHLGGDARRPDLQLLRASCLLQLDRPVEARAILLGMTEDEGGIDPEVWVRLVDVAIVLDDDWLLRRSSDRLIAIAPGRCEGYLALALWQRGRGDLPGALRSARRAEARAGDHEAPAQLRAIIEHELIAGAG
jgi:predicted Zn-dependent protease